MFLTRDDLRELALEDSVIDRILSAHEAETSALRSEFDLFRSKVEAERSADTRQSCAEAALLRAGANPQAVPLLTLAMTQADDVWDGDSLRDEPAALQALRDQYGAFFTQLVPLPTDPVAPPLQDSALSMTDLLGMSEEEINRNWPLISASLLQHR